MSLPTYRPFLESRLSEVTPATPAKVAEGLDGPVSASTALVLLRGLAAEDADIAAIRGGIERLAEALEPYDIAHRDHIRRYGFLAGPGSQKHLLSALDALDAGDRAWAAQYLLNAYQTFTRPTAIATL